MNAFNPSVSCLDKLGQIVAILESMVRAEAWLDNGLKDLVFDPEVRAWMARMRELERLPPLEGVLQEVDGKFVLRSPASREPVVSITNIPEGQSAALSLLDGPEDQIECSAVISEHPALPQNSPQTGEKGSGRLVGYTLSATHPTEGIVATYAEAASKGEATYRCIEEFPWSEKWTEHSIKNTETGEESPCLLLGLPGDLVQQNQAARVVEYLTRKETESEQPLEYEDVVDITGGALSLDEED